MIRFSCPRCIAVLECENSHAGGKTACVQCGQRLRVPTPPALWPLDKTASAPLVAELANKPRLLTWLERLSPSIPPPLRSNKPEDTQPEPGLGTEKVPYVYECVAFVVGFLLGTVVCLLVTPTIGAFLAGLLLGLAAFALAFYVIENEMKWRNWKWWFVVAAAAIALLSGTIKLHVEGILSGSGSQRMFFSGFLGVLVGYPVGALFLRMRPVRLGPETLRTYAAVLVAAAVGVNSSFVFFTPNSRPPSTSGRTDDRSLIMFAAVAATAAESTKNQPLSLCKPAN